MTEKWQSWQEQYKLRMMIEKMVDGAVYFEIEPFDFKDLIQRSALFSVNHKGRV